MFAEYREEAQRLKAMEQVFCHFYIFLDRDTNNTFHLGWRNPSNHWTTNRKERKQSEVPSKTWTLHWICSQLPTIGCPYNDLRRHRSSTFSTWSPKSFEVFFQNPIDIKINQYNFLLTGYRRLYMCKCILPNSHFKQ